MRKNSLLQSSVAAVLALVLSGASCQIVDDDVPVTPHKARDRTVVLSGCNDGHGSLLHCRVTRDAKPIARVRITVPSDLNCDRDSCAEATVIRKDGSVGPLGGIPKGQAYLNVSLSDVVGQTTEYEDENAGPYTIQVIGYHDQENVEFKATATGVIWLTVMDPQYAPISCFSPNVMWIEKLDENCDAHFSTKFRSAICCKKGN